MKRSFTYVNLKHNCLVWSKFFKEILYVCCSIWKVCSLLFVITDILVIVCLVGCNTEKNHGIWIACLKECHACILWVQDGSTVPPKLVHFHQATGCHILSYSLPLAQHFTCAKFQSSYWVLPNFSLNPYKLMPLSRLSAVSTSFFCPQNFQSCHNTRCANNITETSSCTVYSHFNVFTSSHYTTLHVSALMVSSV